MGGSQSEIPDAAQQQAWDALWRRLLLPNNSPPLPDEKDERYPQSEREIDVSAESTDMNSTSESASVARHSLHTEPALLSRRR